MNSLCPLTEEVGHNFRRMCFIIMRHIIADSVGYGGHILQSMAHTL